MSSSQHWQQINEWLTKHQEFWRPVPFREPNPEWCLHYPELAREVARLSNDQCRQLADNSEDLAVLAGKHLPSLRQYSHLVDMPDLTSSEAGIRQATLPETKAKDMPGRKRLQAGAFAATTAPLVHPVLDWCCGKGHLARTLVSVGGKPALGYEWDDQLVSDGNRLADHYQDPVAIQQQDVMAGDLQLPAGVHGVALHACGDLHRHLILQGAEAGLPRLSLSPCCYHLGRCLDKNQVYRPLSSRAGQSVPALTLFRNDIRLAVQETVTAPVRVREQNRIMSQWRLGFDSLQRHLRGVDQYLPLPSYPPAQIHEGFRVFCHWASLKMGLTLPADVNFDEWLLAGARRLQSVRRHELIRHLFRRPLELWLALDYVIFLEEQGYRVRYGQFCERSLTPRNLMIDAVLVPENKKTGVRQE
ncbi:MAG TPA: methyltransferase [Marinobacter sp.]|nr:methyltransferase [Marinobacter sp.]